MRASKLAMKNVKMRKLYDIHRKNVDVFFLDTFQTCMFLQTPGFVKFSKLLPHPQVAHNSKRVKKTERMAAAMPWRFQKKTCWSSSKFLKKSFSKDHQKSLILT